MLGPTLEPPVTEPPPKGADTARALAAASATLLHAAADERADPLLVAPTSRLGIALRTLAEGPPAALDRLHSALIPGLVTTLDALRMVLDARQVTLADLPDIAAARLDCPRRAGPSGGAPARPLGPLRRHGSVRPAVLTVAPGASGLAIIVQGGARTIGDAFLRAGIIATALTVFLLLAALRSWRLAVLALAPLALAGLLTLATCVAMGLPLDFANIIALPLLFAQGVAFDIYYVAAWRGGSGRCCPPP